MPYYRSAQITIETRTKIGTLNKISKLLPKLIMLLRHDFVTVYIFKSYLNMTTYNDYLGDIMILVHLHNDFDI